MIAEGGSAGLACFHRANRAPGETLKSKTVQNRAWGTRRRNRANPCKSVRRPGRACFMKHFALQVFQNVSRRIMPGVAGVACNVTARKRCKTLHQRSKRQGKADRDRACPIPAPFVLRNVPSHNVPKCPTLAPGEFCISVISYRTYVEHVVQMSHKTAKNGTFWDIWDMGGAWGRCMQRHSPKMLQNVAFGLEGQATRNRARESYAVSRGAIHAGCFKRRASQECFTEYAKP
jgi:hypothetical protein